MRKFRILLTLPMFLAGCSAAHGERRLVGIYQVPPGSTCVQSGALDTFKGRPASTELAAHIMAAARAPKLRWVPHGAIITMEFDSRRA